jgi:hypothetical protein
MIFQNKLYFVVVFFMLCFIANVQNQENRNGEEITSANAGNASIEFTHIPPYGSFENLKGKVSNVNPSDHKIAVYIYVYGWWTKPYWAAPLTQIRSDGTWECDVTTGGNDHLATKIAAFLIKNGYNPPSMSGQSTLPQELYQNSLAHLEVARPPTGELFRVVCFSGYKWLVKSSDTPVGPGPNYFSSSPRNVWVDSQDNLHLKITRNGDRWECSEVILEKNLGYGTYIFNVAPIVQFDPHVVLGLFTWDDAPEQAHREIDVEISYWSNPLNQNAQFVVQPWDVPGNMVRFDIDITKDSIHSFTWSASNIFFQSRYSDGTILKSWNYSNSIFTPGKENPRINLWLFDTASPEKGIEVVIRKFEFKQ